MSAPDPATVNVPFAYEDDPGAATEPTSCAVHGAGRPLAGVVTETLSNVDVDKVPLTWLVTASPTVTLAFIDREKLSMSIQLLPSADTYPLIVEPVRPSF